MENELRRIKEFADSQRQERDKLTGKIETCEDTLKDEGFKNVKAANSWLGKATKQYNTTKDKIKKLFKAFKKEFGKQLKEFEND